MQRHNFLLAGAKSKFLLIGINRSGYKAAAIANWFRSKLSLSVTPALIAF
jgi:hypothetical protein